MSNNSEAVKRWRKRTKDRMVEAMGGKCVCCGYDTCIEALCFHHLDPTSKEISFANTRANPKSWKKITEELEGCVLVCNRCHSEIHAGILLVPKNAARFNETFRDYRQPSQPDVMDDCPICGMTKPAKYITCSKRCAAIKGKQSKIAWDELDIQEILKNETKTQLSRRLGVSIQTISKHLTKR